MKEDLLLLNEHNLPERILNRKRSYISLRYWIGWAGGYTDSKKEEDNVYQETNENLQKIKDETESEIEKLESEIQEKNEKAVAQFNFEKGYIITIQT